MVYVLSEPGHKDGNVNLEINGIAVKNPSWKTCQASGQPESFETQGPEKQLGKKQETPSIRLSAWGDCLKFLLYKSMLIVVFVNGLINWKKS